MGLLQRTAGDNDPEGVSHVERRGVPASNEHGREAPDRVSRRSAFAALTSHPPGGSFGFVMATGIVSIAAMRVGHGEVSAVLFALNLVAFPLLGVLMLVHLFQHPGAILSELHDHRTGPGFLTVVAATSIFGDQCVLFG